MPIGPGNSLHGVHLGMRFTITPVPSLPDDAVGMHHYSPHQRVGRYVACTKAGELKAPAYVLFHDGSR